MGGGHQGETDAQLILPIRNSRPRGGAHVAQRHTGGLRSQNGRLGPEDIS